MLLLLPSCFSRVQLCVTPQMAAYRALPSLGFSRQEYWSGLPLPSPFVSVDRFIPQFSSVTQSCPTLCDPMDCSTPGFPVHHQFSELTQIHVHQVGDAIQPFHSLSSPSSAFSLSQHQGLFQGLSSLHQVAKVLEFQLQHQCSQ